VQFSLFIRIHISGSLLNIGFIHQVHFQDGKECTAIKKLYNLVKDHRNPYMQDLVTASYQHSYQEEAASLLGEFEMFTQKMDECGKENVVCVTIINQGFQQSLMHAIGKMTEARLQLNNFGLNMANTPAMASGCDKKCLSDKLKILVNDIAIVLQRLEYASYRGKNLQKRCEVEVHPLIQM